MSMAVDSPKVIDLLLSDDDPRVPVSRQGRSRGAEEASVLRFSIIVPAHDEAAHLGLVLLWTDR